MEKWLGRTTIIRLFVELALKKQNLKGSRTKRRITRIYIWNIANKYIHLFISQVEIFK